MYHLTFWNKKGNSLFKNKIKFSVFFQLKHRHKPSCNHGDEHNHLASLRMKVHMLGILGGNISSLCSGLIVETLYQLLVLLLFPIMKDKHSPSLQPPHLPTLSHLLYSRVLLHSNDNIRRPQHFLVAWVAGTLCCSVGAPWTNNTIPAMKYKEPIRD